MPDDTRDISRRGPCEQSTGTLAAVSHDGVAVEHLAENVSAASWLGVADEVVFWASDARVDEVTVTSVYALALDCR